MIMWGYTGKEISELLISNGIYSGKRSAMAIAKASSNMRKWISKVHDYTVSNYNVSKRMEHIYNKASMLPPFDDILHLKRNMPFKPVGIRKTKERPLAAMQRIFSISDTAENIQRDIEFQREIKVQIPTPPQVIEAEPSIIDVMKAAKELGASTVEYKGVKITY